MKREVGADMRKNSRRLGGKGKSWVEGYFIGRGREKHFLAISYTWNILMNGKW
jgi:hypothetical protein